MKYFNKMKEKLDQLEQQLKQIEAQYNQVLGAKAMLEQLIKESEVETKEEEDANTGSN